MEERGRSTMCHARAPPGAGCTHLHVGLVVTGLGEDAGGGRVGELPLITPAVILLQKCHQVASWGGKAKRERGGSTSREASCPQHPPARHKAQERLPLAWSLLFSSLWRLLRPLALGMRSELRMALLM